MHPKELFKIQTDRKLEASKCILKSGVKDIQTYKASQDIPKIWLKDIPKRPTEPHVGLRRLGKEATLTPEKAGIGCGLSFSEHRRRSFWVLAHAEMHWPCISNLEHVWGGIVGIGS